MLFEQLVHFVHIVHAKWKGNIFFLKRPLKVSFTLSLPKLSLNVLSNSLKLEEFVNLVPIAHTETKQHYLLSIVWSLGNYYVGQSP